MLDKNKKNVILIMAILVGIILLFDILTIITNLSVAPYLDGYGLPDILIYIKTILFLFIFIILVKWLRSSTFNITKTTMKILISFGLVMIIAYFFSLYMYKYFLLLDTANIISTKILDYRATSVYLIKHFSRFNYKSIKYVVIIYSGFNSELILFIEALLLQLSISKFNLLETVDEPKHIYDPFMFDKLLFPLYSILIVTSFLSINLFQRSYDIYGAIEMGFSLSGFMFTIPGLMIAIKIFKINSLPCSKSDFLGWNKFILAMSIISIFLFGSLFVINIIYSLNNIGSYRIFSSAVSLILSFVILIRTKMIMSLENK